MPKAPRFTAAERVDLNDLEHGLRTYPREVHKEHIDNVILDKMSRVVRGFRVELANQSTYPGRITIHAGYAINRNGQYLFNDTDLSLSRTITLSGGVGTNFYVEIEFVESDSDIDARAFWDPTVDQGSDPAGQEFYVNAATRKFEDWQISWPVSVSGFTKDSDLTTVKVPLIKLEVDGGGSLVKPGGGALSTEKPKTTLLEVLTSTKIRVQDASLFTATNQIILYDDDEAAVGPITINDVNIDTGYIGLGSSITVGDFSHGNIVVGSTGTPDLIVGENYGYYRRLDSTIALTAYDYRDKFFQGDEIHGAALARGHNTSDFTERSDTNLQSLKDYIDFLAGQLQELKWGSPDPYSSGVNVRRQPPGLSSNFPTYPRYFEYASSIQGARTATVTVGDGINSWGDFNGTTHTAIQRAIDALPTSEGGVILIKSGTYTFNSDVTIGMAGSVIIRGEPNTTITFSGGNQLFISMDSGSLIQFEDIIFQGDNTSILGITVNTNDYQALRMFRCIVLECQILIENGLSTTSTFNFCTFSVGSSTSIMASTPLFKVGSSGTLSGFFNECRFSHNASNGVLLDTNSSSPANGAYYTTFSKCDFTQTQAGSSSLLFGPDSRFVTFDSCRLGIIGSSTVAIKCIGGENLSITNCIAMLSGVPILDAEDVTNISFLGFSSVSAINSTYVAKFTNCNNVSIKDCKIEMAGDTEMSTAPFKFDGTTGSSTFGKYLIEGNKVEASSDHLTGLIFKLDGADALENVKVVNNSFEKCECGIYLDGSTSAYYFNDFIINGNTFLDMGVSSTVASYQDVGIFSDGTSKVSKINISNNTFRNLNPANATALTGSIYRNAIILLGSATTPVNYAEINNNTIYRVGNDSNRTRACGIYFEELSYSSISENIIAAVYGTEVIGIASSYVGETYQSVIAGNKITTVEGQSGSDSWGIYFNGLNDSQIVNNSVSLVSGAGVADYGAAIGSASVGNNFNESIIQGNILYLNNQYMIGIMLYRLDVINAAITNNVVCTGAYNALKIGIYIFANDASVITDLSIIGNTVKKAVDNSIKCAYTGTGSYKQLIINANNCETDQSSSNAQITVSKGSYVSLCGNILRVSSGDNVYNITTYDSDHVNIIGNCCEITTNGTNSNIILNTGSSRYLINSNTCIGGSGVSTPSIKTSGSGAAGGRGGLIVGNVITEDPDYTSLDDIDEVYHNKTVT